MKNTKNNKGPEENEKALQADFSSKPSGVEADSRSVFVGKVKYCCTIDELEQHFQSCGRVKKVTIGTDQNGKSRDFAFVEFLEPEAVQKALLLKESILHGRQLQVSAKRTNIPGIRQSSGSTGYRSKICLNLTTEIFLEKLEEEIPSKSSSSFSKR